MSLFSQGGSSGLGRPDWASAESVSSSYTAPKDGFIWAWGTCDLEHTMYLYINNKPFWFGYESSHGSGSSCFFPVSKGTSIVVNTNKIQGMYFIPYKK